MALVIASADQWLIAARKEEAEAALRLWQQMKSRGLRLGPRRVQIFETESDHSGTGIGAFLR
jgi:pentatricopeptide repeat protein